MFVRVSLLTLLLYAATGRAIAVDYLRDVKPILSEKCYSCHGVLKQESDLRLETRALMLAGGSSGAVLVPGAPEQSELLARVASHDDDRMPPPEEGAALKPDEVEILSEWIAAQAPAPDEPTPEGPLSHWAFQPVQRPEIPESRYPNAIDAFIDAARTSEGVSSQRRAARHIALRRLYLDLIGLPPTAEQLKDPRPWHDIVDELLTSSGHAERWARHWMDVWRYSDWYGLGAQLRVSQKHLWRWRDWIVASLAEDKGYDQMIREMLAGDEVAPTDPDVIAGTGFLARNYYLFNRTDVAR